MILPFSIPIESVYLNALLIIIGAVIIGKLVVIIFEKFVLRLTKKTKTEVDDKIIGCLKSPISKSVIFLGVLTAVKYVGLSENILIYFNNIIKSILVIIWFVTAARIVDILIKDVASHVASRTKSDIDDQLLPLIDNISRIVVYLIGFLIILGLWGINITPLLASAGIAGFAVAFAAKDTISNFFGGLSILMDKPYKIGDYIVLDSGERGEVVKVGARSTRIKTRDDILISIPNSIIANSKITNESAPHKKLRIRIPFGVSYNSNVDKVEKIVMNIAKKNKQVVKDPAPRVRFRKFGDSAIEFEFLCWIDKPEFRGRVIHDLNSSIYNTFRKEKIEIPFPQMDVHMKK